MSDPYIGEIRWFPYSRTPNGWQPCDGTLLPISTNQALYAVLGTTYGGNGTTTFGVPDLRGRVAVCQGTGPGLTSKTLGERGGTETVVLNTTQMPAHVHVPTASTTPASATSPAGALPAALAASEAMYVSNTGGLTQVLMASGAVATSGSGQPHNNCAPTLTIQAFIAIQGIFPSRS